MIDLNTLTRDELIRLQEDVKAKLKTFKPFRIKEIYKTCGKADCYCQDGIDLHGPYLYAVYRKGGKTKQISLGRKYEQWEIDELYNVEYPDLADYFPTRPDQYEKLSQSEQNQLYRYNLTERQFEERHGIAKHEDNFGRADHYYGPYEAYDRYQVDWALAEDKAKIPYSPWAQYGIGTLKGLAIISNLESEGYYFKG